MKSGTAEGWVYAALCAFASRNGNVRCVKDGNKITLLDLDGKPLFTVVVKN